MECTERNLDCAPAEFEYPNSSLSQAYFQNPRTFRQQEPKIIEEFNFICPKNCGKFFKTQEELDEHLENCEKIMFHCNLCDFLGTRNKFWTHLDEHHKNYIIKMMSINEQNEEEKFSPYNVPYPYDQNQGPKNPIFPERFSLNLPRNSEKENLFYRCQSLSQQSENQYQDQISLTEAVNQGEKAYETQITPKVPPIVHDVQIPNTYKQGTNKIYYCGQKTNLNCGCCEGFCIEGQCICPKCMQFNKKIRNIPDSQYINKRGFLSIPKNGIFCCERTFEIAFTNVYGKLFVKEVRCGNLNMPCPDCQVIKKLLSKYRAIN